MKSVTALAMLFSIPMAMACANYDLCHCYDSNGVPNNAATRAVCAKHGNFIEPANTFSGGYAPYDQCSNFPQTEINDFSNCQFRVWCQQAGATGADSSCTGKHQ